MKTVVVSRENSYVSLGVNRLLSTTGSYSLTAMKRSHCGSCRSCSHQACKVCPVRAEYNRLFDIFCDREEAKEERRYQESLSALLAKFGNKKAATC